MDETGTLMIGLALGVGGLALGFLFWRGVRGWWRAWRYGTPIDHGTLLVEHGHKMTGAPDRQALTQLLTVELPCALHVERAALLFPERYKLVAVDGADLCLAVSHAAVRWVASGGEAQSASWGQLRKLIQQGPPELAWVQVWVPLMRGVDLRGLWLLDARSPAPVSIEVSAEDVHPPTTWLWPSFASRRRRCTTPSSTPTPLRSRCV